jgi:hypothetical protein
METLGLHDTQYDETVAILSAVNKPFMQRVIIWNVAMLCVEAQQLECTAAMG